MRKPNYNVFKGTNGEYYFNLKAPNHEIILQSEGYKTKNGAITGVKSVQRNCADIANYEERISKNNQFYFVLKAKNGEIIGVSETYTTRQAMGNGIADVRSYGITLIVNGTNETLVELQIGSRKEHVKPGVWIRSQILKLVNKVGPRFCLFRVDNDGKRTEIKEAHPVRIDSCMVFIVVVND